MNDKNCQDCKYNKRFLYSWMCQHPDAEYEFCDRERGIYGNCKSEGKNFEMKAPCNWGIPQILITCFLAGNIIVSIVEKGNQPPPYNPYHTICGVIIFVVVLYCGEFWKRK